MYEEWAKKPNESIEEFQARIACAKIDGSFSGTWDDVGQIMNQNLGNKKSESAWRKKLNNIYKGCKIETYNPEETKKEYEPEHREESEYEKILVARERLEIEKQLIREERNALNRAKKSEIHIKSIQDIFEESIKKFEYKDNFGYDTHIPDDKAIYVMLSDIHYGMTFKNRYGIYNSDICQRRLEEYCGQIIERGFLENINTVYISLMGDMISGNIHTTTRIENRESIVDQITGVSELVANFILCLATQFENIYINSVHGNHSRIDTDADAALSHEKLDTLIFWYCRSKLSNYRDQIHFVENSLDSSIANFKIFGHNYIAVHGDYDRDLKVTARKCTDALKEPVYAVLAGHMHVPEIRIEDVAYITNGSVCGSGDDYTVKKRLYAPAQQIMFVASENGIEQIYPVNLGGIE